MQERRVHGKGSGRYTLFSSCNDMIQWGLAGSSLQRNTIPWELGTGGREQGLGQRKDREAGEDVE